MTDEHRGPAGYTFPGRWLGGISLILGPLLLLAGVLLRIRHHFFFPQQLAAAVAEPRLMTASYSMFALGTVALAPAVLVLARSIGRSQPLWAAWGAGLALLGLFGRTYHAGIDHMAFQMARLQGVASATATVSDSYTVWHAFRGSALAIVTGWTVLAIGAWRSGALPRYRAVALALMSALALGTLKGTQVPQSLIAVGGLCVALVPLGVRMLRTGPPPRRRDLGLLLALAVVLVLLDLYGPQG